MMNFPNVTGGPSCPAPIPRWRNSIVAGPLLSPPDGTSTIATAKTHRVSRCVSEIAGNVAAATPFEQTLVLLEVVGVGDELRQGLRADFDHLTSRPLNLLERAQQVGVLTQGELDGPPERHWPAHLRRPLPGGFNDASLYDRLGRGGLR